MDEKRVITWKYSLLYGIMDCIKDFKEKWQNVCIIWKQRNKPWCLDFTISQDQTKLELDRVFNSVKKSLNVPGFREGHLPQPIFWQKFGEESLTQDGERLCQMLMKQL